MSTREQDIKTLQEMQLIKREIKTINGKLEKLNVIEDGVDIDYDLYDTHHADRCEAEKEAKLKECVDTYLKKEKSAKAKTAFLPWVGIAAGVAIIALAKNAALGVVVAVAAIVIRAIIKSSIKKSISKEGDAHAAKIVAEYEAKLEKAEADDKAEDERYLADIDAAFEKHNEETQPEREKLERLLKEQENKLSQIKIISDDDMDNIHTLINILEGHRADNIKEALLVMDEQKRREKEDAEKRRKEAAEKEKLRQEQEAARLASMPGRVHIRIGSINTYSGKLQTVRNAIYIDGANYGAGDASGDTTLQLNPGAHNMYAQLQEAGYIFTTPTQSFNLSGNGDVYVKIKIKNAVPMITLCSSKADLLKD